MPRHREGVGNMSDDTNKRIVVGYVSGFLGAAGLGILFGGSILAGGIIMAASGAGAWWAYWRVG